MLASSVGKFFFCLCLVYAKICVSRLRLLVEESNEGNYDATCVGLLVWGV